MNKIEKSPNTSAHADPGPLQWSGARLPEHVNRSGRHALLRPLDAERDADSLWEAYAQDREGQGWTWLPYGPFKAFAAFREWLYGLPDTDPMFLSVSAPTLAGDAAIGLASFLRIEPAHGVIEIGHIHFSPRLQQSTAATEALFLMMRAAFEDWGYRRLEWKCDSRNAPSRRAAERLGFCFEGLFRQHLVVKGRNRDTAWYSIIDGEWPAVKAAIEAWLAPENFDRQGRQRRSLSQLRHALQGDGEQL